jgi:hypothetical protein
MELIAKQNNAVGLLAACAVIFGTFAVAAVALLQTV